MSQIRQVSVLGDAVELVQQITVDQSGRRVVYTANFGGYDRLHEPVSPPGDTEFVCFTNQSNLRSEYWKIVNVDFVFRDPRRTARLFKCLPHILFPGYTNSLWVDGNFIVHREFFEFWDSHPASPMRCFKHPERKCLYDEARVCRSKGKDDRSLLDHQVDQYRRMSMPDKFGLIASGVLARLHLNHEVAQFCEEWLQEIDKYSVRDQISFPLVAWNRGFTYDLFKTLMTDAPGLHYRPHSKWEFYDSQGDRMISWRSLLWGMYYRARVR